MCLGVAKSFAGLVLSVYISVYGDYALEPCGVTFSGGLLYGVVRIKLP